MATVFSNGSRIPKPVLETGNIISKTGNGIISIIYLHILKNFFGKILSYVPRISKPVLETENSISQTGNGIISTIYTYI